MTRGKHGNAAANRHEKEDLRARVADLTHRLARAETERDEARATLDRRERAIAEERRALIADRDASAAPRIRELEAVIARLNDKAQHKDSLHDAFMRDYNKLSSWYFEHQRKVHHVPENDSWEEWATLVGIQPDGSVVGSGYKTGAREIEPGYLTGKKAEAALAIQRARGLRA